MLGFERQVTGALLTTSDPVIRAEVEAFVDGSLRAMPEHLRAAVTAASLGLGTWARVRAMAGGGHDVVRALEHSRIPQVRQWVRLLRSLVLFAEQELLAVRSDTARAPAAR